MEVVSSGQNSLEIPGYRILKKINQGGMSTVYLAVQRSVGRQVALKVMSPVLNADPIFSERFQREANIVGQLSHPNIVAVHDIGRYRSLNYIAMDYMPGGSVSDRLATSTIDPVDALNITREIALALDHAHGKGYVHRDLKPENILFREDGSAVLTDFGVAKAVARTTRMTNTGMVVGTPHYMSPEQARGASVDGRADLYSLGIVFYEMLTSVVPFQADEAVAIAIKHLTDPIPRLPARHSLYQDLIDRFLAKDPDKRFRRGLEVVEAIDLLLAALAGKPASQVAHLNAVTGVHSASLLKALLVTLYGTASDYLAAAWAKFRDRPLEQKPERQEQETTVRLREVLAQTTSEPMKAGRRKYGLALSILTVVILFAWLGSGPSPEDTAPAAIADPPSPAAENRALSGTGMSSLSILAQLTDRDQPASGASRDTVPSAGALKEIRVPLDPRATASETASAASAQVEEIAGSVPSDTTMDPTDDKPLATPSTSDAATAPVLADTFPLTIRVEPRDARVRVMNIKPRYVPGIELKPGRYDIEVSKPGYDSVRRWVTVASSAVTLPVALQRRYFPGNTFTSPTRQGVKGPEMVVVGEGLFTMGDNRQLAASPAHAVVINRPFAISTREITFDEYDRFARATGAGLPGDASWGRGDRPVINVTWEEARNYARWLSRQTGQRYRLPTEAEWEYASRAGTATPHWWGSDSPKGKSNCRRGCGSEFVGVFNVSTAPTGHFDANPFGLHDTSGNVAEWTQDCFIRGYANASGTSAARTQKNCAIRTIRGGSVRDPLRNVSATYRTGQDAKSPSKYTGFRVLMEL